MDKGVGVGKFYRCNDFFIGAANLPPELKKKAMKIRDDLNEVIQAGAAGDL